MGNDVNVAFHVYEVASNRYYIGSSFVAANSADEAKEIVRKFKESDPHNENDSFGYCENIDEDDIIDGLFSINKGIVFYGIKYFTC